MQQEQYLIKTKGFIYFTSVLSFIIIIIICMMGRLYKIYYNFYMYPVNKVQKVFNPTNENENNKNELPLSQNYQYATKTRGRFSNIIVTAKISSYLIFNFTKLLLLFHAKSDTTLILYSGVSFTNDFCYIIYLPIPSPQTRSIILVHLFLFFFPIVLPPPSPWHSYVPSPTTAKTTDPLPLNTPIAQYPCHRRTGAKITRPLSSGVDRLMLLVYTPEVLLLYSNVEFLPFPV